jgi:hypothetical protein
MFKAAFLIGALAISTFSLVSGARQQELVFAIHNVESAPSRDGWLSLDVTISVSNQSNVLIPLSTPLALITASWREYSYSGVLEEAELEWLPPGHSHLLHGTLEVPEVSYPDVRVSLELPGGESQEVDLDGPWDEPPDVPSSCGETVEACGPFTLGDTWNMEVLGLEVGWSPSPYELLLRIRFENTSGYDATGRFRCQVMVGNDSWQQDVYVSSVPPFASREVLVRIESPMEACEEESTGATLSRLYHILLVPPGGNQHVLFCCRATMEMKPEVLWERPCLAGIRHVSAFAGSESTVYIAGSNGVIQAISLLDGHQLWEASLPGGGIERVAVADRLLYCWIPQHLFVIDSATGAIVNELHPGAASAFVGVDQGRVYLRFSLPATNDPESYITRRAHAAFESYDARSLERLDRVTMELDFYRGRSDIVLAEEALIADGILYTATEEPVRRSGIEVSARLWPSLTEIWSYEYRNVNEGVPNELRIVGDYLLTVERAREDYFESLEGLSAIDRETGERQILITDDSIASFAVSDRGVYVHAPSHPDGPIVCFDRRCLDNQTRELVELSSILRHSSLVGAWDTVVLARNGATLLALPEVPVELESFAWYDVDSPNGAIIHDAPNPPSGLLQLSAGDHAIPAGGSCSGESVVLSAYMTAPGERQVRLEVELLLLAQDGRVIDTVNAVSDPVSGSEVAACEFADLAAGLYTWSARAVDTAGLASEWVPHGEGEISFIVREKDVEPPECIAHIVDSGAQSTIDEVDVTEGFLISVAGSQDDHEIARIRFQSDEEHDDHATGDWTEWYDWGASAGDWDAQAKLMPWSFATPGEKEVWVELQDSNGNSSLCSVGTYAHPGYAIVVAGQGGWREKSGIDHAANNAYRALRNLGFQDDHITYLNAASPQDIDSDGDNEVDGIASLATFSGAVHTLADNTEGTSTPVLIYLVGHGNPDCFVFDEDDSENGFLWVGRAPGIPGLEELLSEFDTTVPCAVVVGSCYSGCFITTTRTSHGSISAVGRAIVTSAHDDDKRALWGWVRSSDTLWAALMKGADLRTAFESRTLPGDISHLWLDDNGDQVGHPPSNLADDGDVSERFKVGMPGSDSLKLKSWLFYWLRSPGELRVCDANGRVTGLVDGQVREEIPDSLFDAEEDMVVLFAPPESYYCEVVGTAAGTYDLEGVFVYDGQDYSVAAEHMPALPGSVHRYSVDWDAIAEGEAGMTLQVDAAGDGEFEETHQSTDYFDGDSLQPSAPAESQAPEGGFPTWLIGVGVAVLILVAVLLGFRLRRAR